MAILIPYSPMSKIVAMALAVVAVSACASTTRTAERAPPSRTTYAVPARTTYSPPTREYFTAPVFQGDTLDSFAKRYGVPPNDILALNKVRQRKSTKLLTNGQLKVPAYARQREERAAAAVQTAPAVRPAVVAPAAPVVLSRPASIEARSLAPLSVPSARNASVTTNGLDMQKAAPTSAPPAVVAPRSSEPDPAPAQDETSWYDWFVTVTPSVASSADTSHRFLWPVEGRVISSFGDNPNGGRNDGINISVPRGTPVRAADAGEVSYVGNELKGYGNLILILHDNGFVTAYAHADGIHVTRGERVERGQIIGTVGETGNVSQPQLHFELRHGTQPVDPTPHLVALPKAPSTASSKRLAEGTR